VFEDVGDGVVESAVVGEQVGQGGVAVPVAALAEGDFGVEVDAGVAAFRAQEVAQGATGVAGQGQQPVGDDQRPGVDEGIAGDPVFALQLGQRVEGCAGGFLAHAGPQGVAVGGQDQGQGEDLRQGLDGEGLQPVAGPAWSQPGVHIGDREAEPAGIDRGQGRNVLRHLPAGQDRLDRTGDVLEQRSVVHGTPGV